MIKAHFAHLILVTMIGHFSYAKNVCEKLYSKPSVFSLNIRADFDHDTSYTSEVKPQADISNQCVLGVCHQYAWRGLLEQSFQNKYGKGITLSRHHLAWSRWLSESIRLLTQRLDAKLDSSLGQANEASLFDIKKFGLMPDENWLGRRDFDQGQTYSQVLHVVRSIIANYRINRDKTKTQTERYKLLQQSIEQIKQVFDELKGPTQNQFVYEGKQYSTQTFTTLFPIFKRHLTTVQPRGPKQTEDVTEKYEGYTWKTAPHEIIEQKIRELIDEGRNVYFTYYINKAYIDNKTGIISISAFNYPSLAQPINPTYSPKWDINSGHAVQVVGYDLDPQTGRIKKFKIKNSYGVESGDQGYYHMYADYFLRYFWDMTYFNDDQ